MKLFRNRDLVISTLLFLLTGAAFIVGGFFESFRCGLIMSAASASFIILYLITTGKRYKTIADLSQKMDFILHGVNDFSPDDYSEGELSILSNEINKMTIRLREQTDQLMKDKAHLKTSIEDIFHQLRTPLTSMQLSVSLLREENVPPEKRLEIARELKTQLDKTYELIETLLNLSKIDAGAVQFEKKPVSVKELVDASVSPFLILTELKNLSLTVCVNDEKFTGDLLWMTEAIKNLVKNCIEHTPEGGEIMIKADENALYTQLEISDSGVGFAEEDIPHLFDRFYKGKNAAPESIGIGLSLSQTIITALGGTISAKNKPDGGASFCIRFYKTVI